MPYNYDMEVPNVTQVWLNPELVPLNTEQYNMTPLRNGLGSYIDNIHKTDKTFQEKKLCGVVI